MDLSKSAHVISSDFGDASFVHFTICDQPCLYQFAQPCRGERIKLVVVCAYRPHGPTSMRQRPPCKSVAISVPSDCFSTSQPMHVSAYQMNVRTAPTYFLPYCVNVAI